MATACLPACAVSSTKRLYMCTSPSHPANTTYVVKLCTLAPHTRANAPSWGRALALAGLYICASNHCGMPCTLGRAQLNYTMACHAGIPCVTFQHDLLGTDSECLVPTWFLGQQHNSIQLLLYMSDSHIGLPCVMPACYITSTSHCLTSREQCHLMACSI